MRQLLPVLLICFLLSGPAADALAVSPAGEAGSMITLRGRLQQTTLFGIPQYEVGGWLLLHQNPTVLAAITGLDVLVTGTELAGPSIYMRKALQVFSVTPVAPAASPREELPITIPVAPEPEAPDKGKGREVSLPAFPPTRLIGTSFWLLFGTLEQTAGSEYYLVVTRAVGQAEYRVFSRSVNLESLVGHQVGVVAQPATSGTSLEIHAAIAVDGDIGWLLRTGPGGIYYRPAEPITVLIGYRPIGFEPGSQPILANGRVLVGLRAVAEAVGAVVTWDAGTRTAVVSLGDREVSVRLGSNQVVIRSYGADERVIWTDVAPVVANGRTMVPLRLLLEGLGLTVHWNEQLRRVELN